MGGHKVNPHASLADATVKRDSEGTDFFSPARERAHIGFGAHGRPEPISVQLGRRNWSERRSEYTKKHPLEGRRSFGSPIIEVFPASKSLQSLSLLAVLVNDDEVGQVDRIPPKTLAVFNELDALCADDSVLNQRLKM